MFGKLGAPEVLLILVVLVLLFGAKRLPGMARSLGQSMRILKSETKAMRDREDEATAQGPSPTQADSAGQIAPARGPQETTATAHSQDAFAPR
ncbi:MULTISPECIES: Sec-independent protein translocase subunit TatA [Streptomyces]|uniref:Sec-independent protein translocase subunit TatA n=1 Tax=Streptomyces pratisoli TaxID=3139917 RepID=A0ACC6QUG9_9ACTN|nr:Sec-independent protein translocase subunit TatA [Streptomyces sp. NBC_00259]